MENLVDVKMSTIKSFPLETCFFLNNTVERTRRVFVTNILTCIIDLLVVVTATASNALVIHVIMKNRTLHSASNILLGCLAVTDLFVGIFVAPLNILAKIGETVHDEGLYCMAEVISSFIGWTSGTLSYLTLALISAERYLAIRLHLRYVTIVTTKRIITVWGSFWFFAVAIAALRLWDNKEVIVRPLLMTIMALCAGLIGFCYGAIMVSVRRHRKHILNHVPVATNTRVNKVCISDRVFNSPANAAKAAIARQKKATLTMFYILTFYFLFCLPSFAYQVMAAFFSTQEDDEAMRVAYRFVFSLSLVNSALNPALYCLRIAVLREAMIRFVKKELFPKITLGI